MSSSDKGRIDPQLRVDDDGLSFPADAEPTDDTPTIISKTHPLVDPKATAALENAADQAARGSSDKLTGNLRGRRLAHFELIEPIGVGGMAAVLRARDTQLDRQVALKILPPEMAADPENIRRFHQEAKAAARLDHENIARVFFCGEDQGLHFIAFEFVEGENLRTLLEHRGRIPVAEAVRYILQVATGLEHASSRGVVHRDVKPSNIIVSPNGRAKLVDMGLARNMERRGDADLTQSGVTLGTFDYISPEQALEPRDADARSDIYSLGCTFYHMLTGQPPVPEGTAAKKLHHHQHVAPVDPRQLNPEIPDEIAMILGRMMHKDPRARYQRPLQLVQHLMQVARKVGAADDLPEGVLFVDAPLPTSPRSRPVLMVAVPFLALGVLIAILAFPWNEQPAPINVRPVPVAKDTAAEAKKSNGAQPNATTPAVGIVAPDEDAVVEKASVLEAIFQDPGLKHRREVKLAGAIKLDDIKNLSINAAPGQSLTLTSDDPKAPATLQFTPSDNGPFGLALQGGEITFENVIIRVESLKSCPQAAAAIVVRGARKVVFKNCILEQHVPPINRTRLGISSVLVDAGGSSPTAAPIVEFDGCTFGNDKIGHIAVALNGAATIRARHCGFRPHAAFFQFRSGCDIANTIVQLEQCSNHLIAGPVFRFEARTGADLIAKHCIFSRYDREIKGLDPDLISQADHTPFRFRGEKNADHDLNGYWSIDGAAPLAKDWAEFAAALAKLDNGSRDESPILINSDANPWQAPKDLSAALAFQLKPEFAGDYGLEYGPWGKLVRPDADAPILAKDEKLFDPDYRGPKSAAIFTNLKEALNRVVSGDVLLIKPGKDGRPIEFPSRFFEDPIDITLRAYPKTTPILTLAPLRPNKDSGFFRVPDGTLRLQGLIFVLEPRKEVTGPLSVVQVGNGAQCTFEKCVITLRPSATNVSLSVVALMDAKDLKMMAKPGSTPAMSSRVHFVNTFIRGDGDLALLDACRRVSISTENCTLALSGSLIDIEGKSDDNGLDLAGPRVELNRTSVFCREPIFTLAAAKSGKGLGTTHIESRNCLFGALGKRPLVFLKAGDVTSEQQVGKYLEWAGVQNVYARFDSKMLEHEKPDEMGTAMQLGPNEWGKLFGETMAARDEIQLPPLGDVNLWEVLPDRFRPIETDPPATGPSAGCGLLTELDSLLKALASR